jgi:hypothetical protein
VGAWNLSTAASVTTIGVTFGFQPKATLLWWSGRVETSDVVSACTHTRGIGFAVGASDRRCVTTTSVQAQTSAVAKCGHHNGACVAVLNTSGCFSGLLDVDSIDSDGITFIVDKEFTTDLRVNYLAFGGDDLFQTTTGSFGTNTSTGDQDITVGFKPDAVLMISTDQSGAPPVESTDSFMMFSAITATQQAVWHGGSNDGAATMNTAAYSTDTECVAMFNSAATDILVSASLVSMLSDGFRIALDEVSAGNRYVHYLAFRGGKWAIGTLTTLTDTVTPISVSGFGFRPIGAVVLSHNTTESTPGAVQDHDRWSFGAFDRAFNRGVHAVLDSDGTIDSEVVTAVENDEVYANLAGDAIGALMDIQSIDADGLTFIMDDAEASAAFVWLLAFGHAGIPVIDHYARLIRS